MQTDTARLKNIQQIYDYFERHPGMGLNGLMAATGLAGSTLRYRLTVMLDLGYIVRYEVLHYRGVGDQFTYSIGKIGRPVTITKVEKVRKEHRNSTPACGAFRKFAKAVQLGMPAYGDLPASFFKAAA